MHLVFPVFYILAGFGILILAAEVLLRGSVSLAGRLNIPAALVAVTIVAFGTSAPELVTSILAALQGAPDVSAGNVVGSNLFNLLAVIGASCLLMPTRASRETMRFEWPFLILSSGVFYFLGKDLLFDQMEGIGLIALFILFIVLIVKIHKGSEEPEEFAPLASLSLEVIYIIGGIIALAGGAHLALIGAIDFGRLMGMSERIIGLTIVSIGTGLPELATSALAAYKGRDDISIGNVIGSNIMNTLAVMGSAAAITPIAISNNVMSFDTIWLLLATFLFWGVLFLTKGWVSRMFGFLLIVAYATYIGMLF